MSGVVIEDGRTNLVDSRIVYQTAEKLVPIDKLDESGALFPIVSLPGVATTMIRLYSLEGTGDPVHIIDK